SGPRQTSRSRAKTPRAARRRWRHAHFEAGPPARLASLHAAERAPAGGTTAFPVEARAGECGADAGRGSQRDGEDARQACPGAADTGVHRAASTSRQEIEGVLGTWTFFSPPSEGRSTTRVRRLPPRVCRRSDAQSVFVATDTTARSSGEREDAGARMSV